MLKQDVGKLPTNCLSVFDHFVGLALKGLNQKEYWPEIGVSNNHTITIIVQFEIKNVFQRKYST